MEFDKNRVFTLLNADEAKIGSIGYFADTIYRLKKKVTTNQPTHKLTKIFTNNLQYRFSMDNSDLAWNLFYLVEEPGEDLCTRRELARWLAEGKGEFKYDKGTVLSSNYCYTEEFANAELVSTCRVRKWSDREWHKPTREYMGL